MVLPSQSLELAPLVQETYGDTQVRIALLDGYADLGHPCFNGAHVQNVSTVSSDAHGVAMLDRAQGTYVASIMFGQFDSAIPGLAPDCMGYMLPVYQCVSAGRLSCTVDELAQGLEKALELNVHIINVSCGELTAVNEGIERLQRVLQKCERQGVLVVAATNKNGCRHLCHVASANSVLAVGATDQRKPFPVASSMYSSAQNNALLAQGENIVGASLGGGSTLKSGANSAACVVSSVAALFVSLQLKSGLKPDAKAVRELLLETSSPFEQMVAASESPYIFGRLNVEAAMARFNVSLTLNKLSESGNISSGMEADVSYIEQEKVRRRV